MDVTLTQAELGRLMEAVAGRAAPGDVVAAIHRRVETDPAMLIAVVRCLADEDRSRGLTRLERLASERGSANGADERPCEFRRNGDYWVVTYGGRSVLLRHSKGLGHLATLLRHAGERCWATDLVQTPGGTAPDPERARLSVTKAVKAALARLAAVHPELADHLSATVRRGGFCIYLPDPRHPIRWKF